MNLLRARRAVERLPAEGTLEIWLGEEGAATVPEGLATQGHALLARERRGATLRVVVRRGGSGAATAAAPEPEGDAWLRRYARQIVMPDVGEVGQRRLGAATVLVAGRGDAAVACAVYLSAAGIGTLIVGVEGEAGARAGRWPVRDAEAGDPLRHSLARVLLASSGARAVALEHARDGVLAAAGVAAFAGIAPVVPTPGRRVWAALAAAGGAGIGVRFGVAAPDAWAPLPSAVLDGPVGFAAGALLADAVMRRVLGFPRARSEATLLLDGTLSDRRGDGPTSAGS